QPLDAFLTSALDKSVDTLEAKANLAQQQAQSDVALGRVLPGVTARGTYTRNQYDSVVNLGGQNFTILPIEQWDAFGTLTVPLIDLAGWTRVKAANSLANAADKQLGSIRLQVEAQVVQGYHQ